MTELTASAATAPSVVKITTAPNPSVQGSSVTINVSAQQGQTPNGTPPPPTGSIVVTANCPNSATSTLGAVNPLDATGAGSFTVSNWPCTGLVTLIATYSGDVNYSSGTSTPLVQTVNARLTPTALTLSSSSNPSTSGAFTLTGQITPSTLVNSTHPTGTVLFENMSTVLGGPATVVTSGTGEAVVSLATSNPLTLPPGQYNLQAIYSGDSNYASSTSQVLIEIVSAGAGTATHFSVTAPYLATVGVPIQLTVTALDGSNNPVPAYSDAVHFTATDSSAALPANTALTSSSPLLPGDISLGNGTGAFRASLVTPGLQVVTTADAILPSISGTTASIAVSAAPGLGFIPVYPCRVVDTRTGSGFGGVFGPPFLAGQSTRSYPISSGTCGIPATAEAYSLNVTVVPHGALGYLTVWPTDQSQPLVSTLNSIDGRVKANAAIVPAGTGGAISVFATNDTDVILDINGYFVPASTSGALAFYPATPCRVVDTRNGTLLSGAFAGGSSRTLPMLSSSCGIPSAAQAYSLNVTVVAPDQVGYITAWPTGQSQPVASTLNALPPLPLAATPLVVANAAIVPAGTGGSIDVFATDATNLVVDINGYFAPAGTGGLSLYNLPPCRVLDTRQAPFSGAPFSGAINVNVLGSVCGGTPSAQAYVLNATVVPQVPLGYLTLWPQGATQPLVSTLNAVDGAITSNMAIVPTSNTNLVAFATDSTQLIFDISGYFAP